MVSNGKCVRVPQSTWSIAAEPDTSPFAVRKGQDPGESAAEPTDEVRWSGQQLSEVQRGAA